MYPEKIYEELKTHAEAGLFLLRELLPTMTPVGQYHGWTREEQRTLGYILSATARASESVALLVAYGQLWDAEVLTRSVTEGTLKFCYLLLSHASFKERHREYSHDLFRIALFKDHKKVQEFLRSVPNPDAAEWKPVRDRLLPDEEAAKIGREIPAPQRRALETRWGFTGLVSELAASNDPIFQSFRAFLHEYSNASHIQHVDYIGAALALDRDRRTPERRDLALLTHGFRIISDMVSLFRIRLQIGYRFIGGDLVALTGVARKIDDFSKRGDATYKEWMAVEYP